MIRYTEEELLQLKSCDSVPITFDINEFRAIIEKVKELQALQEEEFHHFRRRSSHHHSKPKFNKHLKPKITIDEDGWSKLEPNNIRKPMVDEDGEEEEEIVVSQETLKVKPNKNISSSRPADARDIITDKQTMAFNAFAALESEDEEDA